MALLGGVGGGVRGGVPVHVVGEPVTIETKMDTLDIRFQPIAQNWFEMVTAYALPQRFPGHKARVIETRRTLARQDEVATIGASQLRVGYHNFGLALDFAIFGEEGLYLKDGNHPAYLCAGQIAEALGCVWGGRWKMKDSGHIEYHPDGVTLDSLRLAAGLTTA